MILQPALGVAPGLHLGIKSTSERARVTLAYAAAAAALRALRQWRDLTAAAAGEAYRRQLAAADAASVHSRVTNALGVPAQLQLDFGDRVCAPHAIARPSLCCFCLSCLSSLRSRSVVMHASAPLLEANTHLADARRPCWGRCCCCQLTV